MHSSRFLHRARTLFFTFAASRKGFNLHVFCIAQRHQSASLLHRAKASIAQSHQSTSLLHRAKAPVYKFAAWRKGFNRAKPPVYKFVASRKGTSLQVCCMAQRHQSTSLLHRAKASIAQSHQSTSLLHRAKAPVYKFAAWRKGISLQVCCIAQRLQLRKAISLLCCIVQRHLSISLLYCTKASNFTFAVSCKAISLQVCCIAQRLKSSRLLHRAKPSVYKLSGLSHLVFCVAVCYHLSLIPGVLGHHGFV